MHMRAPGCKLGVLAVAVVLVEGISDQLALEALAARRGLNLDGEGIAIVPMGGSKNIWTFLERFGPRGSNVRLAGLCDGRTHEAQLRRFFGTHGGRKIESAALLVDALDLDRVPRPLDLVLAHVKTGKRV